MRAVRGLCAFLVFFFMVVRSEAAVVFPRKEPSERLFSVQYNPRYRLLYDPAVEVLPEQLDWIFQKVKQAQPREQEVRYHCISLNGISPWSDNSVSVSWHQGPAPAQEAPYLKIKIYQEYRRLKLAGMAFKSGAILDALDLALRKRRASFVFTLTSQGLVTLTHVQIPVLPENIRRRLQWDPPVFWGADFTRRSVVAFLHGLTSRLCRFPAIR